MASKLDELMGKYGGVTQPKPQPTNQRQNENTQREPARAQNNSSALDDLMQKYWTPTEPGSVTSLTEYGKQVARDNLRARLAGQPIRTPEEIAMEMLTGQTGAQTWQPGALEQQTQATNYGKGTSTYLSSILDNANGRTSILDALNGEEAAKAAMVEGYVPKRSPYAEYLTRADYAEKSQAGGSKLSWLPWSNDAVYDYINDINGARDTMDVQAKYDGGNPQEYGKYAFMTPDEIGVYNYIYATEGKKAARRFLKELEPSLNQQWYSGASAFSQEQAVEHPFLYSAATVAGQPVRTMTSGLATVQDAYRAATGQGIDPNSELRMASRITSDVREAIAKDIEQSPGIIGSAMDAQARAAAANARLEWQMQNRGANPADNPFANVEDEITPESTGKAAAFAYQTAMSAADSAVNMWMAQGAASGYAGIKGLDLTTKAGTDALMKATNVIGSLTMSSEVMSLGVAEAKEKGYSDAGALTVGMIRGAVEYASEAIGGEWVIKNIKANPMNFVKSMVLNMIPEGVEEVMSDAMNGIVNLVMDEAFGTQESGITALMNDFSTEGWQERHPTIAKILGDDATPLAATVLSLLGEESLSFLGGALATVGSSGVQTYNIRRGIDATAQRLGSTPEGVTKLMEDYKTENPGDIYELAQFYDAQNEEELRAKAGTDKTAEQILEATETERKEKKQKAAESAVRTSGITSMFRGLGTDLTEAEAKVLADGMATGDADAETYLSGVVDAFRMGESGKFTLQEAMRATDSAAKLTESQFRNAWELGRLRSGVETADVNTQEGQTRLEASFASMGENAQTAIDAYEEGQDIDTYAAAMNKAAALYAANGQDLHAIAEQARTGERADIVGRLTDAQLDVAMQIGQAMSAQRTAAAQQTGARFRAARNANTAAQARAGRVTLAKQSGSIDGIAYQAVKAKDLSRQQKNIISAVGSVSKVLGLEVTVVKATGTMGGAYVGGGRIYLNIDAGTNLGSFSKAIAAGSFSHEMTHWLQEYAPEEYDALRNIVTGGMSAEQIDSLVQEQLRVQPNLSPDEALNEVVANACQPMLENSKAFEQIARENMTLAEKILDFMKQFAEKLKAAFEGIDWHDNLSIYHAVQAVENRLDEMQKAFDEAIVAARGNMAAEAAPAQQAAAETKAAQSLDVTVGEDTLKIDEDGQMALFQQMTDPDQQTQIGTIDLQNYEGAVDADGKPLFQVFAFQNDEPEYRKMLEAAGLEGVDIDRLFDTVDAAMEKIMANLEILDYAWERDIDDRVLKTVKPNSDHLYKVSVDFSTLCRKRIMQSLVHYQLQEALDRVLTKEEGIAIRDALMALQQEGKQIEVACGLCYVESARMKSPEQIKKFLENREAVIRDYFAGKDKAFRKQREAAAEAEERQKIYEEFGLIRGKGSDETMYDVRDTATAKLNRLPGTIKKRIQDAKRTARSMFQVSSEQQKVIDTANSMTVSDFTTAEGLEDLAKNHRDLFDAYTSYIRNATKSKGIENDVWWRVGDSQESISDRLIAEMNAENGLRTQSWSDFQVMHMMDYIAETIELSTRKAKQHAYTKVIDYVDLMGQTGVMINMSLIPAAEYSGTLEWDDVEGIVHKEAFQMRDKYHATAGTIAIGINYNQIRQLLASDLIDYVIPYHHSGMGKATRVAMHLTGWDSFQDYQTPKALRGIEAERNAQRFGAILLSPNDPKWHQEPAFSEWFSLKEAQRVVRVYRESHPDGGGRYGVMTGGYYAMQQAAEQYKQMCAERGLAPKFSYGKNGDFSMDDNYWKLLIDRKMVDNVTGDIIEQKAIKPVFDLDVINRILDDEIARYGNVQADQEEAVRRGSEAFLSGKLREGMTLDQIAEAMQPAVDNVTNVNIIEGAKLQTWDDPVKAEKAKNAIAFNNAQTETGSKLKTLAGSDIKRGGTLKGKSYPVGKIIGNSLYIHKSYIDTAVAANPALGPVIENAERALREAYPDFEYNAIAWRTEDNEIQFQQAPGFDTEREPVVGMQVNVSADGTAVPANRGKPFGQIWHHKWEWVGNDYAGFDVNESWEWSRSWLNTIVGPSKGGSLNAWNSQLNEYHLPQAQKKTAFFQLVLVDPVQPSSDAWQRTMTEPEALAVYPDMWDTSKAKQTETEEEKKKRDSTQRANTLTTYRKIYEILQRNGFTGKVLDASSGLGLGTQLGRDEFGFDVTDIEPYPDPSYKPMYTDYSTHFGQYDAIISSAVLNVLAQDQRDALVVKMGQLLKPGGKMYVTTRTTKGDVDNLGKTGKNIQLGPSEYIETVHNHYQKGFTNEELRAYMQDALGDDFTVEIARGKDKFNNNTAVIVTKANAITVNSTEEERYEILKNKRIRIATANTDLLDIEDIQKLATYDNLRESGEIRGKDLTALQSVMRKLATKLGINKIDLQNSSIAFPFTFSNTNVGKSTNHQKQYSGTYTDLAKAISCIRDLVEGAELIETHTEKKEGTTKENSALKQVYVLLGAMRDGARIIPAELVVKEFYTEGSGLYMTVTLANIEDSGVVEKASAGNAAATQSLFPESEISIQNLIDSVNTDDGRLFKYVPSQMLSEEKQESKERALERQERDYDAMRKPKMQVWDMATALGVSEEELNRRLDPKARKLVSRITRNAPAGNRWNGIQNSAILNEENLTDEDIRAMVAGITGTSTQEARNYIGKTIMALDTNMDWGWLSIDFARGYADRKDHSVLGFYDNSSRAIEIGKNGRKLNTVAHEMGHALDYQWARDLFGGVSDKTLSGNTFSPGMIVDESGQQFYRHFRALMYELKDAVQFRNTYEMYEDEIFARFVARFVEWTRKTAGNYDYTNEAQRYKDRFTEDHYVAFARLLQEKAAWDADHRTEAEQNWTPARATEFEEDVPLFQRIDVTGDDTASERTGRETAYARLQNENAILNKAVKALNRLTDRQSNTIEKLQRELHLSSTPEVREADARKLARNLVSEYGSTADVKTVAAELKALGDYLLQTPASEIRETELKNRARSIAAEIVSSAQETVDMTMDLDANSELASMVSDEQVNPFEAYMGEATEDLANRIAMDAIGGVLRQNTTAMDRQKARRDAMREQIKQLKAEKKVSERRAGQLYRAIDELLAELDKAEGRYRSLQESAEDRLAQMHAEGVARAAEVRATERARANEKITALKEYYQDMAARQRERRNESAGVSKYRKQVDKKAKALYELLMTNSNDKHVPEVLKAPLGEFLQSLNFASRRSLSGGEETRNDQKMAARLLRIQQMLANQQSYINGEGNVQEDLGGYIDVSSDVLEELRQMAEQITQAMSMGREFTVNQMNADQLKTMSKFLSNLTTAIKNMNSLMANARYASVKEAASGDVDFMKSLGKVSERGQSGVSRFTMWKNGVPWYVFKRYGEGGRSIFDGFTKGWEKMAINAKEIIDFTDKTYTDKEVREWKKETHDITLESGEKIRMTTGQIMELAMLLGREQAMKHITKGGIRIGDIETRKGKISDTNHYHLTGGDIAMITGALTDRQMEVAKALQSFMAKRGGEWGNEISMRRFGYNFYEEGEGYYPIRTDSNDRPMADTDAQTNSMFRLLNLSSSKSLNPKASNALVVDDIFATFSDHMADMAKLNGMGLPILDAIKWFNFKERIDNEDGTYDTRTLQGAMEEAYGGQAQKYFRTLMKDINGQTESGDRGLEPYNWFLSNYKAAAVGANLRVAMLQPTSYVRALTVLKPKYLALAFSRRNAYQEAMKYSGTAVWKSLGYFDTDIAKSMRGQIEHDDTLRDKIVEKSMVLAELGDKLTWGRLWNACKLQAHAENASLTGEALMEATADLFRQVIYSSQVMDGTLTRSETMRAKGGLTKMATAFMAEPTLSYNILLDSFSDYNLDARRYGKAEAWKRNAGKFGKAVIVYINSAAFAAVVESLADAARDDDDDKYWDKFLEAFIGEKGKPWTGNIYQDLSLIGKLPVLKDAASMIQGYKNSNLATESLTTLFDAYKIWDETYKLSTGELDKATKITSYGKMTSWGKIYKTLQALSQISGLPGSNMMRDVFAVWNTMMNGRKDEWKIKRYDSNALSQSKVNAWKENVKDVGISQKAYQQMLQEMNADGNSSVSQAEAAAYLSGKLASGDLTREQVDAIWSAVGTNWKKSFDEVAGKGSGKAATTTPAAATPKTTTTTAPIRTTTTTTPTATTPATKPSDTTYKDFQSAAPIYGSDKRDAAYAVWRDELQGSGMSLERFTQLLTAADTDGNSSLKQAELGGALREAIRSGEMTEDQAIQLWNTQGWKTSFQKWNSK